MTSEPDSAQGSNTLKTATIKKWTGNDPLTCRFLHCNSFTFSPRFTLVLQANDLPKLSKSDKVFERRFKKIPFPISFVESQGQDLENGQKFRDETLKQKMMKGIKMDYYIY